MTTYKLTPPRSVAFVLVLPLLLSFASAALAQVTATQARDDSTLIWVAQAKDGFRAQLVDSVRENNSAPFDKVGLVVRNLLHGLPGHDLLHAREIQPMLDSLDLSTEIAVDPQTPGFALVMVRNPWRLTSEAVGYLYWYRQSDLRVQGVVFRGGYHPDMRVWWTGQRTGSYKWGIVDQTRAGVLGLTLLWVTDDGMEWEVRQSEQDRPTLSEPGRSQWVDLNGDGSFELVTWTRHVTDSLFSECADCPRLLTERTYTEGRFGFEPMDERLLPTPYATLTYFVRLLLDGRTAQAARLLRNPEKVKDAIAAGWNKRAVRNPWFVERGEPGQPWPRRLGLRFQGPYGVKRYDVIFGMSDGKWIIEDWFEPRAQQARYPSVAVPPATPPAPKPATPARKPAAPKPAGTTK